MVHWFIYAASAYVATSLLFFCFPTLLRSKKKYTYEIFNKVIENKKIMRISHRGGPQLTTQNTKEAFKKVVHVSDMIEMDVCETKDNILVVHHDKSLLRTCGVHQNVKECNYKDLPKFKQQIQLDFAENKRIPTNNEKIPTLQEIFQIFQGVPLNIQLKTPTETAMKQFARLIYEYDRKDITIVGIRNKNNNVFKKQNPNIHVFMNDRTVAFYALAYFLGLLPFVNIPESSLQFPVYSDQFKNWKMSQHRDEKMKIDLFFGGMKFSNLLIRPMIWHFQRRGIMTYLWVCNDIKSMDRALQMGGQGIMTDQPFLLDNYLKQKQT